MSSFTPAKLDKSATIKACNQLSMICEVILTRLSRADFEKYTRNNGNIVAKCRRRGRPRRNEKQPFTKSVRQSIKKHETIDNKISSSTNNGPVVEFVDCSLNVEALNTSAGVAFNLQMQEFVDVRDEICNVPQGILLNKNSENRYGNVDFKKKRKSVTFIEDNKTCKKIRLEESSMNNNNPIKTNSPTLSEGRNQNHLYCNKGRMEVDKIHDTCRQMIFQKSSENVYKRAEIISESLGTCHEARSMKPTQPIKTSNPKDPLFDPAFPLPIKSEHLDGTSSYGSSNNKLFPIDELDTTSPVSQNIPDGNDLKYEQEGQQEFSQVGHENCAEMCVGISAGSIYNENLNTPFTFDAALLTSSDSPHETSSNMVVLDTYPCNEVLPNLETLTSPRVCIGRIDKQEVSKDNDFTPVISAVGTVHTLERHHASFDSQSISVKSGMEMSNERGEEFIMGRKNTVTEVDANGYNVKESIHLPFESEGNKKLASSTLDDCITIDDDNDEIIDLTDSEEIINCDDDDEVLPENCNINKNEENLPIYVDADENSRLSLNSNTSEELVDLTTETGNIVVFDGLSNIQASSDEESTAKTCVKENRLSSKSDLATTHTVIVSNVTTNQENRKDTIDRDEVITFDHVDLNNIANVTSTVENCSPNSLLAQLLSHSDNTCDKATNTMSVTFPQSLEYKKFDLNSRTTVTVIPVGKTIGSEENSCVGKIRVRDLSNLSSVQHSNSSKEESVKEQPVTPATNNEDSDLLISLRKEIWSKSGFTDEEKNILRTYKRYFFANTEEIIEQMGHIIHLAVCDNLNYIKYSEQVNKLLTGDTISIEKLKAEKLHNSDIVSHGTNFVRCLKEFVSRVNIRDLQDMVFIMVCRALDSFIRIDLGNKKYYRMARDVLREMLAKINCDKYYRLDRIIYMDTYQFLKKYNATIKLISRYCEFITNLRNRFQSKLTENSTASNALVKQSFRDGLVTNLRNIVSQEQPVVPLSTSKLLSVSPDQSSNVLLEQSKQPLVKGVLLLNAENMTKLSDLSIDELLQVNKQVYINLKQKYFLQCYQKYFLGTTDEKLVKLGDLLHVVTCEMLCQNRKLESISSLPHSALKICEEGKILTTYENNLKNRGSDFVLLMKDITSKFNEHSFSRMVCAVYCRITEIFLKIDINNIKYFVIIRDVVKKMLELNEFYNKDLFELLTMKEQDFVRSYNSVIHILMVYYELMKSAQPQNADGSTGNSSRSEQNNVGHKTSEGNIIIPLTSRAVEVPILKRISKNSILIV